MQAAELDRGISGAIRYLVQSQLADGEFLTECRVGQEAAADGQIKDTVVFDSSPFVTSLLVYSLEFVRDRDPGVQTMIERGCRFLRREMEPGGLWRYWSHKNPQHAMIPPDLDDISCISQALRANRTPFTDNRGIILDSRNRDGSFYTWLYRVDSLRKLILWLRTGGRAFSWTEKIWKWTNKDDVCCVVNANVVHHLGETPETVSAIEYLVETVRAGLEERRTVFYWHRLAFYYMLSRAYRSGAGSLGRVRATVIERVMNLQQADGSFGDELLTAQAICSLLNFEHVTPALRTAADYLLRTQLPNGSWRRIPMYGGPPKPDAFGSADLTTGFCLEALARLAVTPERP